MSNGTTLNAEELRVLAALIEKSHTTPDQYPLSSNALTSACNQKSSRDPVVDYSAQQVDHTLQLLRDAGWVRMIRGKGNRTFKHRHVVDEKLSLTVPQQAVFAVLALRGPQSPGELKTRTERYHPFEDLDDVERVLQSLAAGPTPLVRNVGRAPGQSQDRWIQLLGPSSDLPISTGPSSPVNLSTPTPTPTAVPVPSVAAVASDVPAERPAPPTRSPRIDGTPAQLWSDHRLLALQEDGWDAIHAGTGPGTNFDRLVRVVEAWNERFRVNGKGIERAWTTADLDRLMGEQRAAVFLTSPDPSPLDGQAAKVEVCHLLGLCILGLAGGTGSPLVGASTDQTDEGLTELGRGVVAELNRHGMVPDIGACGVRSAREVIDAYSGPVVLSGAAGAEWTDGGGDEVLASLAAAGGLAVFNLDADTSVESGGPVDVAEFCEQVADAALTNGADHIALGSRPGANRPEELDLVVDGLATTGFEPAEIEAMSGGNWRRVHRHDLR